MIEKSHRWQKTVLAATAAVMIGLVSSQAHALSLGRIAVSSALGEPLRAEIDLPGITAEEASSLKTTVALPDAFRSAGIEYNPIMSGLQISLQRRPDGRSFLRISSERSVNDPFIDLILDASWSSGRIVSYYTMLLDPPNLRQAQSTAPTLAQTPSPGPAASVPLAPAQNLIQPTPSPDNAPAASVAPKAATPARLPPSPLAAPAAAKSIDPSAAKRVIVKNGDNASKIAAAYKAGGVSLDQMLVALLRSNPDAFINGNLNRLRAGTVMNIPESDQAAATPAREASQIVIAQSKDFGEYRNKLASSVPLSNTAPADRQASGKIQGQAQDKKPTAAAPDKLTLSKGAIESKANEDKIAKERASKEAALRAEALNKNIEELNKLSAAAKPATPPPVLPAAVAPVAPAPDPVVVTPPPVATVTPAVPVTPAVVPPKPAAPVVVAEPENAWLDELIENPMIPAAAGGLIALLAGLGVYRSRQRKKANQQDSSYLESRLQPDSFFGASGGQKIDTTDAGTTGSSMVYSPSQTDGADDVDPVAEADVYLAYGRDTQAVEILREALRSQPGRVAVHQKLLEIYAKRQDTGNFEQIATESFKLLGGDGAEWDRVCDLGLSIDPTNPLYQPGGHPDSAPAPLEMSSPNQDSPNTEPFAVEPSLQANSVPMDLDLDLDFSLDDEVSGRMPLSSSSPNLQDTVRMQTASPDLPSLDEATPEAASLEMSFEIPPEEAKIKQEVAENSLEFESTELPQISLPEISLPNIPDELPATEIAEISDTAPSELTENPAPDNSTADTGMLEFDLGSLSLDLGTQEQEAGSGADDPLATKLALAEEFNAIGDTDGARALIEEIIAEATGEMKTKAQLALSQLS